MTCWDQIVDSAQTFDGVTLSNSYGEPSLKVGKAFLARHRLADNSIVLKSVDPNERDELITRSPEVFFLEDHYVGYDIVLARLEQAELMQIMPFIERTWRCLAPKGSLNAYEQRSKN
ncbi:MAG: hypothetical protein WA985_06555 [Erythrobacter sp.]